jgi:hypothetical protein
MEGSWTKRRDIRRNVHDTPLDAAIAALAARQHGVVALAQLEALGLGRSGARDRVASGRLHRVHGGVFAVGHPLLTRRGRLMAAVLACGEGAALSHRSAAALRGLRTAERAGIDVTSRGCAGRRRAGIRAHSAATLAPCDVGVVDGIPCTSLARTLLDLAEVAPARELERALDRAEELRVLDMQPILDVLDRSRGRRGAAALRAVLADHDAGSTPTRNELEEAFLATCRDARLPPDAVNAWIPYPAGGGAEGDFVWRAERLDVEVDGRGVHATRRAFEHDRRRDQRLTMLGWRVVRFSWRQVMSEPATVAEVLRELLPTRRAARSPR